LAQVKNVAFVNIDTSKAPRAETLKTMLDDGDKPTKDMQVSCNKKSGKAVVVEDDEDDDDDNDGEDTDSSSSHGGDLEDMLMGRGGKPKGKKKKKATKKKKTKQPKNEKGEDEDEEQDEEVDEDEEKPKRARAAKGAKKKGKQVEEEDEAAAEDEEDEEEEDEEEEEDDEDEEEKKGRSKAKAKAKAKAAKQKGKPNPKKKARVRRTIAKEQGENVVAKNKLTSKTMASMIKVVSQQIQKSEADAAEDGSFGDIKVSGMKTLCDKVDKLTSSETLGEAIAILDSEGLNGMDLVACIKDNAAKMIALKDLVTRNSKGDSSDGTVEAAMLACKEAGLVYAPCLDCNVVASKIAKAVQKEEWDRVRTIMEDDQSGLLSLKDKEGYDALRNRMTNSLQNSVVNLIVKSDHWPLDIFRPSLLSLLLRYFAFKPFQL